MVDPKKLKSTVKTVTDDALYESIAIPEYISQIINNDPFFNDKKITLKSRNAFNSIAGTEKIVDNIVTLNVRKDFLLLPERYNKVSFFMN